MLRFKGSQDVLSHRAPCASSAPFEYTENENWPSDIVLGEVVSALLVDLFSDLGDAE